MKLRPLTHVVLLLLAMQATSAFKFRCWLFCTDQTGIQTDYIDARDQCRKYAQLRIETDTSSPELMEDRGRKAQLISLFSSCMGDKGWTVPDGKNGQQAAAPTPIPTPGANTTPLVAAAAPAPLAVPSTAIVTAEQAEDLTEQRREKTALARASECAFARHSAAYSSVAATRAKACDLECAQRLKANPKGKLPAPCPADPSKLDLNQP